MLLRSRARAARQDDRSPDLEPGRHCSAHCRRGLGLGTIGVARQPDVSIVLIFHNEERFLREAIESVLAQTYSDWELLLVDDGSTDRSSTIADSFARSDPSRIHYLTHPGRRNRGMSASRNLGIRQASGEYLAFLDGDDVYRSPKLEKQVAILNGQTSAAMVYGATEHWYSWSGHLADRERDKFRRLGVSPDQIVLPPKLVSLFLRREAQTPGICGLLARRSAVLAVGAFEEKFRGMFEDAVLITKLCLTFPVFVESGRWDRYRIHDRSHSRVMHRWGLYRALGPSITYGRYLRWVAGYAEQVGVRDAELLAVLECELRPYRNAASYALAAAAYHADRLRVRVKAVGTKYLR